MQPCHDFLHPKISFLSMWPSFQESCHSTIQQQLQCLSYFSCRRDLSIVLLRTRWVKHSFEDLVKKSEYRLHRLYLCRDTPYCNWLHHPQNPRTPENKLWKSAANFGASYIRFHKYTQFGRIKEQLINLWTTWYTDTSNSVELLSLSFFYHLSSSSSVLHHSCTSVTGLLLALCARTETVSKLDKNMCSQPPKYISRCLLTYMWIHNVVPYYLFTAMADLTYSTLSTLLIPGCIHIQLVFVVGDADFCCAPSEEILLASARKSFTPCLFVHAVSTQYKAGDSPWCKGVLFCFAFVPALHSRLHANMNLGCPESKIPILWRNRFFKIHTSIMLGIKWWLRLGGNHQCGSRLHLFSMPLRYSMIFVVPAWTQISEFCFQLQAIWSQKPRLHRESSSMWKTATQEA